MGRLIDADRLKEVFSRNVVGGNVYFDLIDNAPTVEAIPKADYEARLKADMVAMLEELKTEIAELKSYESADGQDLAMLADIGILFQQKINALKGDTAAG